MKKFLTGLLGIAATANPLIGGALSLVNGFLPADKKLPAEATGQDVQNAYDQMPPDMQAQIDERAEVELAQIQASVDKLGHMVSVESASGNTRPHIALLMAYVVALAITALMVIWGIAVWQHDANALKSLTDAWPLALAILATPTALLRAYFGMRTNEKKARYAAATGQPIAGVLGAVAGLLKR
jgi:hypothetical protein